MKVKWLKPLRILIDIERNLWVVGQIQRATGLTKLSGEFETSDDWKFERLETLERFQASKFQKLKRLKKLKMKNRHGPDSNCRGYYPAVFRTVAIVAMWPRHLRCYSSSIIMNQCNNETITASNDLIIEWIQKVSECPPVHAQELSQLSWLTFPSIIFISI
jgi:hypothetical protein